MKALLLADIHATRRPPSSCTDTYWDDLLGLLAQTAEVAASREVHAACWAGDIFHHKAQHRTDHGLVQDLIRVIRGYPCPVYVVAGNHDLAHDRLDSIEATQPLGVLFKAGARRLEGRDRAFPHLYGVPWLQEWSEESVREALRGYREDEYAQHGGLIVTHAPLYPPGREPFFEHTPAQWWSGAVDVRASVFYGHVHEPHGTWRYGTGEGVTFCNNGALSRGSLDEHNLHRDVGCTLWDSVTGEFEFIPLKAKPAAEVFRLRQHEEAVTAKRSISEFAAGVDAAVLQLLSVETTVAHIRAMPNVDRAVADLAEELLMQQQGGS